MEFVQLVDEKDNELGVMEKITAHREAKLHRAVSVFIFNDMGEMLLQRRAAQKYHSALLWTNACCTHPRPNEKLENAASRRLYEEMGMICGLQYQFNFIYKAVLDNGLTEHEYDHVYFGESNGIPAPDKNEVAEWQYLALDKISVQIAQSPELFTEWFKIIFDQVKALRK